MKHATLILPLLIMFSAALVFTENVFADYYVTDNTTFRVDITEFLTLTVDQTDNIAHLNPSTLFNTGSIVASVATNNVAGYTLTFEDKDDRNGLERAGYSSASVADKPLYNIPSVSSATTYANLADDTYGYYLGSATATEATYLPVPFTSTEIDSSDEPTSTAVSTTLNFGVKIAATRPSGTYEDVIVISAVATPLPLDACVPAATTISEAVCMQDVNSDVINSMVTETQYQLRDNRDDKMYWIAKLADGKVWMTQNLDLNLVHVTNDADALYTHANTDLGWGSDTATVKWNPERSTIPTTDIDFHTGTISNWTDDESNPYSIDVGDWYWTDTWYYSDSDDYLSGNIGDPAKFKRNESFSGNGTHGHVGNYYNWTAAIASNDSSSFDSSTESDIRNNPQNSICPAGWRLPTVSDDADEAGSTNEFKRLTTLYGNNDQSLTANPLYFVRGGGISSYGQSSSGESGYYWSSTVDYSSTAYDINMSSYNVYPEDYGYRENGFSVRCVARGIASDPDPSTTTFDEAYAAANKTKDETTGKYVMQDMTTSICDAVTTPTQADNSDTQETLLVDNRDGKLYWVAKLKDGHCWMTQNLDLDLVHIDNGDAPYNHSNTDLGWGTDASTTSWNPENATITASNGKFTRWSADINNPYSADPGDWYWTDTWYSGICDAIDDCDYLNSNTNSKFSTIPYTRNGAHGHVGNYYNWTAAIASNDSSSYTSNTHSDISSNPQNSICPAGWKLPEYTVSNSDFYNLTSRYGNTSSDQNITASPLWFVRGGFIDNAGTVGVAYSGHYGSYWSSTVDDGYFAYYLDFYSSYVWSAYHKYRATGSSVRCLAR